jgi:hypothetical protein
MSETLSGKSVPSSVRHYGRVPETVYLDLALSDSAVRVYAILAAGTRQGNVATLGMRKLADMLGVGRSTINRRISQLVSLGHLKPSNSQGKRAFYELTSPVFGQKQRDDISTLTSSPRGRVRLATVDTKRLSA